MAGKLRVKRKSYTRSDGTRVKGATFKIKDRGARGRTPKRKRWFEPGEPLGWRKEMPVNKRRGIALRNRGGDYLATARALQALANVTTDQEAKVKARLDASYFFNKHKMSKRG